MQKNTNRLINEKSPYLLQHAGNPVDWFPWGEEAFAKARLEDKPIFLSIGYSTCHWCHVMEHESFEDKETADLLNQVFVSIKVDREERPDIDNIYMMVCQMMTGSGGWPLSVIMTPDRNPFYAGTYFPKETKYGRIGFKDLIKRIDETWRSKRKDVEKSSIEFTDHLYKTYSQNSSAQIDENIFTQAFNNFEKRFDSTYGGFGSVPKFPSPHNLMFLLRYWKRTDSQKALNIVVKTLTEMRRGGIFDQIGFGFHRYSTDSKWLVPHFEKMLYDQALLTMAYTEAYQATGNSEFAETVNEIATYILRDMTSHDGAFYSAEDADSEGAEGKFYVWTQDELIEILGKEDAEIIFSLYNVSYEGNFHDEATHQFSGANIFHLTDSSANDFRNDEHITSILKKLFDHREKRVHPYKDDKILTDWNGLMIAALAKAGRVLANPSYISAAERAAEFINEYLTISDGKLIHRYRDGDSNITANLDDYAFMVWALFELYESTFKTRYINQAIQLTEFSIHHFWDEENGGFFFSPDYGENLIVRTKEYYDGAVPSGNSIFALNLLRLSRITADSKYEDLAGKLFDSTSQYMMQSPQAFTQLLCAFDFAKGPSYEVIVAGDLSKKETQAVITKLTKPFIPNKVIILADSTNADGNLPFRYLKSYSAIDSRPTIYVCKNFTCNLPTTDIDEALHQLI
ncbi:thioredoxin domain-containing protein [bacterium]|nr:thioredoxin domain-containing protein [bacterium]